jgi:hypothetical protein
MIVTGYLNATAIMQMSVNGTTTHTAKPHTVIAIVSIVVASLLIVLLLTVTRLLYALVLAHE